jgi:hypothetical protein
MPSTVVKPITKGVHVLKRKIHGLFIYTSYTTKRPLDGKMKGQGPLVLKTHKMINSREIEK